MNAMTEEDEVGWDKKKSHIVDTCIKSSKDR